MNDISNIKILSNRFLYYTALVDCLNNNKNLKTLMTRREQLFSTSKLKEYLISEIFRGNVVEEIGCDIAGAKLLGNKRIEVKTTQYERVLKKNGSFSSREIIIAHPQEYDGSLHINSDYFLLNFEYNHFSVLIKSKYIKELHTFKKNKVLFNLKHLNKIEYNKLIWPKNILQMTIQCILNLLKYGASPDPKLEYGHFENYLHFCLQNQTMNFYKNCKDGNINS